MNKEKWSRVFTVLISITSIIFIVIIGKWVYNETWPQKFSEEEEKYYKEIASKAWYDGLSSISEKIDKHNQLITDYSQGTETVTISFYALQKNVIIVESSKKGCLTFDFSDTEITTNYKSNDCFSSMIAIVLIPIVAYATLVFAFGFISEGIKDMIRIRKMKKDRKKGINLKDYSGSINHIVDKKGL